MTTPKAPPPYLRPVAKPERVRIASGRGLGLVGVVAWRCGSFVGVYAEGREVITKRTEEVEVL